MPQRNELDPNDDEMLMCNWLDNFTGKPWKIKRDPYWTFGGWYVRIGTAAKHIDVMVKYVDGRYHTQHPVVHVHVREPDMIARQNTNVDIFTESRRFSGNHMTIGSETIDEFKRYVLETGARLGLLKPQRKDSKMNMMRTWAIWGTVYATGEPLETLEIDAESFDDALNIARTVHPDYCAGQVIG